MMKSGKYLKVLMEQRRYLILRLLGELPDLCGNSGTVHLALEEDRHRCTYDQVVTDLAWLEEQGLLALDRDADPDSYMIARLTPRGVDVAARRCKVPGILPPVN